MKYLTVLLIMAALVACKHTSEVIPIAEAVGDNVRGNFGGSGSQERATVVQIKPRGEGEDDNSQYEIRFSNKQVKKLKVPCCAPILVNEGDLNGDGQDELSIYNGPNHGCTYALTTYSFQKGKWREVIPMFLMPTACDDVTPQQIQDRVIQENGKVYKLETDPNDDSEQPKLKKILVKLK